MDQMNNLRGIVRFFAFILKNAIEIGQIHDSGRLIFDWDGDSLDCRLIGYKGEDVEEGDINV